MAKKTSGRRGAAIIALIAAIAALAGSQTASANAAIPAQAQAAVLSPVFGIVASWAEEASWAEN